LKGKILRHFQEPLSREQHSVLLVNAGLKHECFTEVYTSFQQLILAEVDNSRQIQINGTCREIYLYMIRLRRTLNQLLLGHNLLLNTT